MKFPLRGIRSALCQLLCAGACALWLWSMRHEQVNLPSLILPGSGDRATLRIVEGRLNVLLTPRPVNSNASRAQSIARFANALSNNQVRWRHQSALGLIFKGQVIDKPQTWLDGPFFRYKSPAACLAVGYPQEPRAGETVFTAQELAPFLLRAMEDPRRFVAAHLILARVTGWDTSLATERPDGSYVQDVDGLRVELRRDPRARIMEESTPGGPLYSQDCLARFDPNEVKTLRDRWHRRFDAEIASASLGWLAAASLILPALSLVAKRRARQARRAGHCYACGYDLRATPNRCPECGTAEAAS